MNPCYLIPTFLSLTILDVGCGQGGFIVGLFLPSMFILGNLLFFSVQRRPTDPDFRGFKNKKAKQKAMTHYFKQLSLARLFFALQTFSFFPCCRLVLRSSNTGNISVWF